MEKNNLLNYIPTIDLDDFLTYWKQDQKLKSFSFIAKRLLTFRTLVEIPAIYQNFNPSYWRAIDIVLLLNKKGIFSAMTHAVDDRFPDEPQPYITTIRLKDEYFMGYCGTGRSVQSKNDTIWPAIGEAIERWSLKHYTPNKILKARYNELSRLCIDPRLFNGPSKKITTESVDTKTRYTYGFNDNTVFTWTEAYSLSKRKKILVPAQTISQKLSRNLIVTGEPLITSPVSTGAASGQTLKEALKAGTFETIERDAFMCHWLLGNTPQKINLDSISNKKIQQLVQMAHAYHLEPHLLHLAHDTPTYTTALILIDRTGVGPAVNVSAATGFDIQQTIIKNFNDALASRPALRFLYKSKGSTSDIQPANLQHESRALFWSKPERLNDIDFFISGQHNDICSITTNHSISDSFESLIEHFRSDDKEIYYSDCTNKFIRKNAGISTVKVCIPEFQPLYLDERQIPPERLHDGRIADFSKKVLGSEKIEINNLPHPFL